MSVGLRLAGALLAAMALAGCDAPGDAPAEERHEALGLDAQEDAVCGMLVREQSAPRAQAVHGDGSRFYFCSIDDMLVHLSAPSPHGRAEAVFVEVMASDEAPGETHTGAHPWVRAEDAVYVVGIDRPGIMGDAVLSYADRETAEQVASRYPGAEILDVSGLRERWAVDR